MLKRMICLTLALCLARAMLFTKAETTDLITLQERLLTLGYEIGMADGILGTKTSAAIRLAQTLLADAGFDVKTTGEPDEYTVSLIMSAEN